MAFFLTLLRHFCKFVTTKHLLIMLIDLTKVDAPSAKALEQLIPYLESCMGDKYNLSPVSNMGIIQSPEVGTGFCVGNAIKYLSRYLATGGNKRRQKQDLIKAIHYLLMEVGEYDGRNGNKSLEQLLKDVNNTFTPEEADSFLDAAMADAAAERTDMRNELAQIADDEVPTTKRERQIELAKQIFDCTDKSLEYNERGFWDIDASSPYFINRKHFSYVDRDGSLESPNPTPQLIQEYFDLGCPAYLNLK